MKNNQKLNKHTKCHTIIQLELKIEEKELEKIKNI